jgi:hypothetical protein
MVAFLMFFLGKKLELILKSGFSFHVENFWRKFVGNFPGLFFLGYVDKVIKIII